MSTEVARSAARLVGDFLIRASAMELHVLGTLVLALSAVQAFAPPACVLRVPVAVRCQRRALASAARDAESRRKMAIFDAWQLRIEPAVSGTPSTVPRGT
jgi:hypothetical protein